MNFVEKALLNLVKKINYKFYTKIIFKKTHGYKLDLVNPKSFNEKIQWMKLNGNLEKLGMYVDKNEVRDYVRNYTNEKYLISQIGCYQNSENIDFDKLPERFVIKATHASGWNKVVENKNTLNFQETRNLINKWVNDNYYNHTGEENYRNIKGRVVIEEFIEDSSGDLMDYRFFCYNGIPYYIQLDSYADIKKRRNIYDTDWNLLDCKCGYENILKEVRRPEKLDEMLDIVKKLSNDFNFVRVDLYYVNNEIFFGELTFTPQNGFGKFNSKAIDDLFGENFELRAY